MGATRNELGDSKMLTLELKELVEPLVMQYKMAGRATICGVPYEFHHRSQPFCYSIE
jgi:hypothetical protein